MISTLGSKFGLSPQQISRNEVKKSEVSEEIKNTQDKSESKVAKISQAIADGIYKIDLSKTARAIADEIM
ncbi:flagellar biosynthesis anti-sigma factor FlgM [Campylobacter sp. RM15925]|uniref:flagellar biosynthesis anti-sigma factor FlgM n=1 Tax=Campylobacter sp. RM15925 TaxID=1705724 RepID=UPI00147376D0|nr:flagellar biosynthesis anti-sigma factor FlgM [Campylobacter sp. RM15925]